jgi:hypothetical protein
MPGDIVGVNDRGGWHGPMKHVCDAGLSASAAAIHGQNPRSVMTVSVSVDNETDKVTDRHYSPWTRRRLPGAKLHVHFEIPFLVVR